MLWYLNKSSKKVQENYEKEIVALYFYSFFLSNNICSFLMHDHS